MSDAGATTRSSASSPALRWTKSRTVASETSVVTTTSKRRGISGKIDTSRDLKHRDAGKCGSPFVGLLVFRRIRLYRLEVERQEAERRLEPLALALVNGEEIEAVDARDTGVLAGLLSRYARQVTGDSRSALASYFERSGGVEREVAELG